MRKITKNLVTLVFIIVAYFAYSTWLSWLESTKKDSTIYQVFSPFRLILLGALFAMIIPTFKSIFLGSFIGIKNYRKNKTNFLLFNYKKLRSFLVDLKSKVEKNDHEGILSNLESYNGVPIKPIFVDTLIKDIQNAVLCETDLTPYVSVVIHAIEAIDEVYDKEKHAILGEKRTEAFFDYRRGYEMMGSGSKFNLQYYEILYLNTDNNSKLGWKIVSLNMFKFYWFFLTYGLLAASLFGLITFPILGKYYENLDLSKWGFTLFLLVAGLTTIIVHFCKMFFSPNIKASNKKYLLLPSLVYYALITLMIINIVALVSKTLPDINAEVNKDTTKSFLSQGAFPFIIAIAYIVLSSALILYVISTLMDAFKEDGLKLDLIIEGIVAPLAIWLGITIFNIYYINQRDFDLASQDDYYSWVGYVSAALFIYWIVNWFVGSFMSSVVRKKQIVANLEKKDVKLN